MNKLLILFTIIFLGCNNQLDKTIHFFDNFDFNSGNYRIYFIGLEGNLDDKYKNFYIEDIKTLNDIKETWIFDKKSKVMSCGYEYNMFIVQNDKIIKTTAINLSCGYMTGWIKFPKEYLLKYKDSFILLDKEKLKDFKTNYIQIEN